MKDDSKVMAAMKYLRALVQRFSGLFRGERREREFAAELESHVQLHVEDNMRAGMSPEESRRNALAKLGGLESTRQAYRERNSIPLIQNLLSDLRFACRQLYRNPGFAVVAIVALALGSCASVAIFTFVDATLLRSLPYREPARIVALFESTPSGPRFHLSYLDYLDWRRLNTVFSALEAYDNSTFLLKTSTGPQRVDGATVSAGFFRALGVAPMLGRDFRDGEDTASAPLTVLLSYSAWQQRFGGQQDALGQTIQLGAQTATIVGVLPRQFHFAPAGPAEFWTALHESPTEDRGGHGLSAIARLKNGVSLEISRAEMQTIAAQLARRYPDADAGRGATVVPLTEMIVGNLRPILLTLLGGAGLLLLIAYVNVVSLLLVRSEVRSQEIALRGALGASQYRLAQQFITEGLLIVTLGNSLGLAGSFIAIRLLRGLIPVAMIDTMPYLKDLGLNAHMLGFACAISLAAALLFSMVPMLHLSADGMRKLGERTNGFSAGGRSVAGTLWRRLGANLVIAELATAMVLLVGAGLLAKSLYRLLNTDIGMQPEHLIELRVLAPSAAFPKDEQVSALARRILDQVQHQPWVAASSISHALPIGTAGGNTTFEIVGKPTIGAPYEANERQVSPGYFTTLQARLLRGRFFTAQDDSSKPPVLILNRTMARMFFPGENPIGKRIALEPAAQIVGIVDDVKEGPLDQATRPALYRPFDQEPDNSFYVLVRTSQAETTVLPALSTIIHSIDPKVFVSDGGSMVVRIQQSSSAYLHRSSTWLVSGFAGLALLLGAIGLYGVLSYSVSQRTREIGVRMALGAQRSSVYRLILREAGWLTVAGIAAGAICSIAAAMLMRSLLFGVAAFDLPTLAAVAAVLVICALLASYLPARRAASLNPMDALRAE